MTELYGVTYDWIDPRTYENMDIYYGHAPFEGNYVWNYCGFNGYQTFINLEDGQGTLAII